jgi:hypothetical protein
MQKISLNLTYRLKQMITRAGGTFSRNMIPAAIRNAYPKPIKPSGGLGPIGKLILIVSVWDMMSSTAQAPEIPRPQQFEIPLDALGLGFLDTPDRTPAGCRSFQNVTPFASNPRASGASLVFGGQDQMGKK